MKYDVSIVIPFFNNEKYLEDAIKSIINQNYDFSKIELILINDFSNDNSLKIAEKYSKYKNIIIISNKKNEGVSKTRNAGLKIASGKYVMFLDGDDYISENTVSTLVDFFDKNYEKVDLVTYPIYLKKNDESPKKQPKYDYFDKGTTIYDLNEYPYINQCTINVIFKNNQKYFFDENMKLAEDQKFNTIILMKKKKIGYCEEAKYIYRRYGGGVSQRYNSMYYCYEGIIGFNEWLIEKYKDKKIGKVPKYIQGMIINTLSWRLKSDMLFPYYLEGKEYENAMNRIFNLAKQLDNDFIYSYWNMSLNHKLYWLKKKDANLKVELKNNMLNLLADDYILETFTEFQASIKRLKIHDNYLYMRGTLTEGFFEYKKPKLYLIIESKDKIEEKEIKLFESTTSYNKSRVKLNYIFGFEFYLELKGVNKIRLELEIDNCRFKLNCNQSKFSTNKKYSNNFIIVYRKQYKSYFIKEANFKNRLRYYMARFIKNIMKTPKVEIYRLISVFLYKKEVWLYYDLNNFDNGYYQFIHDVEKNDGIKRYYVCKNDEQIKKINSEYKRHFVKFKSFKNKILYLNSAKVFTSNSSLIAYCPFGKKYSKYKDILNYDLIYLQHGVLHANLSFLYNKENTEIYKFVISSDFEENNLIKKYGYSKEDLIKSGMPRYDIIQNKVKVKNKILFVPSWRMYLSNEVNGENKIVNKKDFLNSNFYNGIMELINNERFVSLLEDKNLTLDLKLHPYFQVYNDCFTSKSNRVNVKFDDVNLLEYKLLITDFSSFQFDFISSLRPIIYFIPDIKEFKAGLHTYRELDLKQADAFGNTYYNSDDVINEILRLANKSFQTSIKYKNRMSKFFCFGKPGNSREKIYRALMNDRDLNNNLLK